MFTAPGAAAYHKHPVAAVTTLRDAFYLRFKHSAYKTLARWATLRVPWVRRFAETF
jgi:hypothetical protein